MTPESPTTRSETDDDAVAMLVHELRGPLTVIAGYAQLLRRPLTDEERVRAADALRRAVKRLDTLLDEFAAGRGPTCPAPLALERVELAKMAARAAQDAETATGRTVLIDVSGDPCVFADEGRLERVLSNLLGNADKFSPPGTPLHLSVSEQGTDGVFVVADEGPGVPAAERARVLERFERLERDAGRPGSGLGLAIVREIVEAHGGSLAIGDRDGGGASFEVRLPLCPPSRA